MFEPKCEPCDETPSVTVPAPPVCADGEPCKDIMDAKCVNYSGANIDDSGITTDMRLDEIIQLLVSKNKGLREFSATFSYASGDTVLHEGLIYKANDAYIGAWDDTKFDLALAKDNIPALSSHTETSLKLDYVNESGVLFTGKKVFVGAADSGAAGYRTLMIEN